MKKIFLNTFRIVEGYGIWSAFIYAMGALITNH
jgi:hypothetical protein